MGDQDKEQFMRCIRSILKADKRTIEILRTHRMSDLKQIERASRRVKDPNTLASTSAGMNDEYPITINRKKALKYKVPAKFMPPKKEDGEDTHEEDRVPCKIEAVDWWITESPLPSKEIIEVIDNRYKKYREEVKHYLNVTVKEANIKWGHL